MSSDNVAKAARHMKRQTVRMREELRASRRGQRTVGHQHPVEAAISGVDRSEKV
jgi:hypothetical protein